MYTYYQGCICWKFPHPLPRTNIGPCYQGGKKAQQNRKMGETLKETGRKRKDKGNIEVKSVKEVQKGQK
jgi:hypothetical protein